METGKKRKYLEKKGNIWSGEFRLEPRTSKALKRHGFDGGKKDKSLLGRVSAPRLGGLDISEILLRKLLRLDDLVTSTGKLFVTGIYRHFMGRTERRRLSLFKKSFLLSPVGCSSKCKVHFCDPLT